MIHYNLAFYFLHLHRISWIGLFWFHVHNSKYPFCSGKRREDRIHLHRELIDGPAELPGIADKNSQAAHRQRSPEEKKRSYSSCKAITDLSDIAHHRPHDAAEKLSPDLLLPQRIIQGSKILHCFLFMTEYLYYILSGHSLFDITIQGAQRTLLFPVIRRTLLRDAASRLHHYRHHHNGDQRQPYIICQHNGKGADNTDDPGHQLRHRIIQKFTDHVNIIGKTAHNISHAVCVKIAYRHILQMIKEIFPDPDQRSL